jgi:hypothetical protein
MMNTQDSSNNNNNNNKIKNFPNDNIPRNTTNNKDYTRIIRYLTANISALVM